MPRDGFQDLGYIVPPSDKIAVIAELYAAGHRWIEVTSMVRAEWVPQFVDAEEVLMACAEFGDLRRAVFIPNRRGLDRALGVGLDEASFAVAATDGLSTANFGRDRAAMLDEVITSGAAARDAGVATSVTIGGAFGCPYEGDVELAVIVELADALVDSGIDLVLLADTIGSATVDSVAVSFAALHQRFPRTTLGVHLHGGSGSDRARRRRTRQRGDRDRCRVRWVRRLPIRSARARATFLPRPWSPVSSNAAPPVSWTRPRTAHGAETARRILEEVRERVSRPEELRLLTFEEMSVGRSFPPRPFVVTSETLASYIDVTGDDDPAYHGTDGIVPPGLAGVWARLAYADGHRLPPGGFMASQQLTLLASARIGESLLLSAQVVARGEVERRELTLECHARDSAGQPVGGSRIEARWGATP